MATHSRQQPPPSPPEHGGEDDSSAFRRFAAWAMERFDDPELLTWPQVDAWDRENHVHLINRDPQRAMETHIKTQVDHLIAKLRLSWSHSRKTIRAFYSLRPADGIDIESRGYMPFPWVIQNPQARQQAIDATMRQGQGLAARLLGLRASQREYDRMETLMRQVWQNGHPED